MAARIHFFWGARCLLWRCGHEKDVFLVKNGDFHHGASS